MRTVGPASAKPSLGRPARGILISRRGPPILRSVVHFRRLLSDPTLQRLQQQTTVAAAQKRKRPLAGAPIAEPPAPSAEAPKRRPVETWSAEAPKRRSVETPAAPTTSSAPVPAATSAAPVPFLACAPRYVQANLGGSVRDASPAVATTADEALLRGELAELQTKLTTATEEKVRLVSVLRGLEEKSTLQSGIITSFEAEVDALEAAAVAAEAEVARATAAQAALHTELGQVTADLATAEDAVVAIRVALNETLKENKTVRAGCRFASRAAVKGTQGRSPGTRRE